MTQPKRSKKAPTNDAGYDVGYGKPPKKHRFKPGHSGNPKGRPKGAKNEATILHEIMHQRMEVREDGRPRRVSRLEALLLRCLDAALKGDLKAMAFLFNRYRLIENADTDDSEPLAENEKAILEDFANRILKRGATEKEQANEQVL